jgi:hypothetical protein
MDEVDRLEEQRVQAERQVKKLSLIRDRAHSNVFELEGMETNPARRPELLQKCEDVAHLLDSELWEAQEWLQYTAMELEIARKQSEVSRLRERRGRSWTDGS